MGDSLSDFVGILYSARQLLDRLPPRPPPPSSPSSRLFAHQVAHQDQPAAPKPTDEQKTSSPADQQTSSELTQQAANPVNPVSSEVSPPDQIDPSDRQADEAATKKRKVVVKQSEERKKWLQKKKRVDGRIAELEALAGTSKTAAAEAKRCENLRKKKEELAALLTEEPQPTIVAQPTATAKETATTKETAAAKETAETAVPKAKSASKTPKGHEDTLEPDQHRSVRITAIQYQFAVA